MRWRKKTKPLIRIHISTTTWVALAFPPDSSPRTDSALHILRNAPNAHLALKTWLTRHLSPDTGTHITLANALCRFWLCPGSPEFLTRQDQAGLAWLRFQSLFGPADREEWRLWLATRHYNQPQLAVAVPEHEIHPFTLGPGLSHTQIQPIFTACWDQLADPPASPWLVQREGERCLLVRQSKGHLQEIQWRPSRQLAELQALHGQDNLLDLDSLYHPPSDLDLLLPQHHDQDAFRACLIGAP